MKPNDIIVVGGSSGIGLSLCQKLAERNITVISKSACPVSGVRNIITDVRKPNELSDAFSQINKADALIYCAGVSLAAPVEYVDDDDCRALFDTNIIGAVEATKYAMPLLRNACDGGRIIYLASSGAIAPIAFDSFYSASKAALVMLARALRLETDGIKATAALIGGTRTRFSFKRKIYDDCGDYDEKLKIAADALIKIEQTGYTADFVAGKLIKLLDAKSPPAVCSIGLKNKLALAVYRLMPQCLKHAVDKKIYRL